MSGYISLTSYSDRIAVLNDIQAILTLMRTWNNDAQRVEQYMGAEGFTDDSVTQGVKNALRGMGPGTDLTTSNFFNQYLKTNIDGNYNTVDHRYWLPADATLPYSRGLSWLHSYPNPVKAKVREAESFFFETANRGAGVESNLYRADTLPLYGATLAGSFYHSTVFAGWTQTASSIVNADPYFSVSGHGSWNIAGTWTHDLTLQTMTAASAAVTDLVTSVGATTGANRSYDIYVKVNDITAGGFEVHVGSVTATDPLGAAKIASTAGWHWFYAASAAGTNGQISIVPTSTLSCTISEIKVFNRAIGYGSSTIGWEEGANGGRTIQDNSSFIAARKQASQFVSNAFGTNQNQVAMYGYPFSDFKEDTAYAADDPNWDGDIIEIVGGPPDCSKWAIVREVLWDPVSLRRGSAIRVQQLYDTGTSIALKTLTYPVVKGVVTNQEPANVFYNSAGCQIYRRFTYVRS